MQGRHGFSRGCVSRVCQTGQVVCLAWIIAVYFLALIASMNTAWAETRPGGDLAPIASPNGILDAGDLLILQRIVMGSLVATPEQQLVGDVAPLGNPDGVLNAADVVVLMRAVMGQVSLPPVYLGPNPPVLANAGGVTYDNPLSITGTAEPGYLIRLYVNGALQGSATAATDGSFSFAATLVDGNNALYAALVDAGSEGPVSSLLEIDYQNNRPRNLSGVISQDSVWTPGITPTPYVISGDLSIAPGVTLILQPGTTLQFDTGIALNINGGLQVLGTPASPVTFTSNNSPAAPGDWVGIRLNPGSTANSLDNAVIEYANVGIQVDGTQAQISNSTIREIRGHWSSKGIAFMNGAGGVVEGSSLIGIAAGFSPTGIEIQNSDPHIRNNSITTTDSGIFVQNASPWLSGNQITNSYKGIYLYEGARALVNGGNVLSGNSVGLQFGGTGFGANPDSIVTNNSVFNNQWNVYISGYDRPQDVEVPLEGNWWGSVSPSVISSSIFDHKDVWGEGAPPARVVPYLDGPNGQPVPGNFLGGRVGVDTTLAAGEPYTVISSYVLSPNISLTIPPGANIAFSSNAVLHARGSLFVQGQEDNRVTFSSSADTQNLPPGWGVLVGDLTWQGIIAEADITGAQFDNLFFAVEVGAATATISDSLFMNNDTAIRFERDSSGAILGNSISGQKLIGSRQTQGINVSRSSDATVSKNTVTGLSYGLFVNTAAPVVQGNIFQGNTYGINAADNLVIDAGNTITGNDVGILSNATGVRANNNNIYDNGDNYYKANFSTPDDATNNWWGTTVEAEVASGIYQVSPNTVTYVPFLTGPVPVVPVLTATTLLTNNSSYAVSGTAQAGVQVRIYVNAAVQTTLTAQADGQFTGTVTLSEGENIIHAEAFNATTTSSASASLRVTLDTLPPTITLDTPANSALINRYPTFTGSINEPATLTIASESVTLTPDIRFSHGPVTLTEGANSTAVVATDLAGNTTTRIIYLTLDTTPPADPNLNLISFDDTVAGQITVNGSGGSVQGSVKVRLVNARSGNSSQVISNPDGSFTLVMQVVAGDELSLFVADDLGNQSAWSDYAVTGTAPPLAISITSPQDAAVITANDVSVTGTITGPANTGVVVNGIAATVVDGTYVATHIPMAATGSTLITVTATHPDSSTASQSISVNKGVSEPVGMSVSPDTGVSPLLVTLDIDLIGTFDIGTVEFDADGNGTYEIAGEDITYTWGKDAGNNDIIVRASAGHTYTAPGIYAAKARIQGTGLNAGNMYSLEHTVAVQDPVGLGANLRGIYNAMLKSLVEGNPDGALRTLSTTMQDKFTVFFSGQADFATWVPQLGEIVGGGVGTDIGFLVIERTEGAQQLHFTVYFECGADGVWRIAEM